MTPEERPSTLILLLRRRAFQIDTKRRELEPYLSEYQALALELKSVSALVRQYQSAKKGP